MHDGLFAPAGPFWHIIALHYSICEGFLKAAAADEFLMVAFSLISSGDSGPSSGMAR